MQGAAEGMRQLHCMTQRCVQQLQRHGLKLFLVL